MKGYFDGLLNRLWYETKFPPFLSAVLNFPYWVYSAISGFLRRDFSVRTGCRVVGIGNIVVGGTGKTPFTVWLAEQFLKRGVKPVIVTGGYRRSGIGTGEVIFGDDFREACEVFGDEAFMIARILPDCPVWAGKKWFAALMADAIYKPDVVLVDDAFQHRFLKRDIDILLFDAHSLSGNSLLLPFGPLREPMEHINRASLIVFVGSDYVVCENAISRVDTDVPFFIARRKIEGFIVGEQFIGTEEARRLSLYAFAGISKPYRFFEQLVSYGFAVKGFSAFPDHYMYSEKDIKNLYRKFKKTGADLLVCTEKDYWKIPKEWRELTGYAVVKLDVKSGSKLMEFLESRLNFSERD